MKTAIQELIEKYSTHLKHDDDLEEMSGKDILKIVLVDLISYQVKEKEQIKDAQSYAIFNAYMTNNKGYFDCDKYYLETFKQD